MQHHSFFSNAQYYSQYSTVYFINGHQTLAFMWVKNLFKLTLWLDGLAAGSTVSNWESQI